MGSTKALYQIIKNRVTEEEVWKDQKKSKK